MKEITKWEYLFFWGEGSQIQELGEKGWEIVSIEESYGDWVVNMYTVVFKRPITQN